MDKRPPFRPLWFSNQSHLRLMRKSIAFTRVTSNARADHIFPGRQAALIAWQYMIEIQFAPIKNVAAILAGVLVALKDVVAREFHFLFRQAIEEQKHNYARHPNLP